MKPNCSERATEAAKRLQIVDPRTTTMDTRQGNDSCRRKRVTYNVRLGLAVVTGSETTLTALSGGGLQVRRKSATSHCVCVGYV